MVLAPLLAAGLIGFFAALDSRGADAAFLHEQENPETIRKSDVEIGVRSAPQPDAFPRVVRGVGARCAPGDSGPLKNPWHCTVRYPGGETADYRITIDPDGSFMGDHRGGSGTVDGCCIAVPGAD